MSELAIAVLLGLVEGLTEFIPVSSTGHLIIVGHLFGFVGERAATFEIFIQLGAILAVVLLYWRTLLALLGVRGSERAAELGLVGREGIIKLVLASFPVCLVGLLLHRPIKQHLFSPFTVALGLALGGVIMIIVERKRGAQPVTPRISARQAFLIGLCQCFSLWPGVSRAGAAIVGALLVGSERRAAAEFSFLVAVPVIGAAAIFDLLKSLALLNTSDLALFATGFIVSFLTAVAAIKLFLHLLQRLGLVPFGLYRVVVAILVLLVM